MTPPIPVSWRPREPPLAPTAAWAEGEAARRLAQRLLAMPRERLDRLEGVTTKDLVVIAGATEDLPWIDGIQYLGRDPQAPDLLLPTRLAPSVPAALLRAALRARPAAVLPDPPRIVRVDRMLRVSSGAIVRWLEAT